MSYRQRDFDDEETVGGNETSPLLQHDETTTSPQQESEQKLPIWKLLILVSINGGVQVFFSTIMADLSPYLQSLSLSKSAAAMITICLPLSGAFVGPIVGAYSDRFESRFGRRRPVILTGAIATTFFLCLLAWSPQIVNSNEKGSLALAIVSTLLMSISIQPVQTGVRSLTVDIAPAGEQNRAWSWAGRIQGFAAIFSFFASSLNLPSLPGLGRLTQFQALAALNLITLGTTVGVTMVVIKEEDSRGTAEGKKGGVLGDLKGIWKTIRSGLPGKVRGTCIVQVASWMAWFPLLYYTTTFIGELDVAGESAHTFEDAGDELAQAGSLGSLSFATVGFIFVTALPALLPLISRRFKRNQQQQESSDDSHLRDLIYLWMFTQPILGILEILTLAAAYQWQGIVLVGAAGIPWAVTQWVPFAIIGFEVSRLTREGEGNKAGAILGVHNMAISLPQVFAGLVASGVYRAVEEVGSQKTTAWVLAISGIAAFVAAFLARRML
ncbi:General alpha-glucoside permease [Pseudocercospora fuligena]|uniref:General alpha-glucoside permease n=1 Tax=Pseudocercospora fuligena TaxID=685502 RepID=A0A8H6RUD8_9PEZI|nr:General alpha-glucoside permease [Pseudocercospora fuligena]